jgi:hypothetical protein
MNPGILVETRKLSGICLALNFVVKLPSYLSNVQAILKEEKPGRSERLNARKLPSMLGSPGRER